MRRTLAIALVAAAGLTVPAFAQSTGPAVNELTVTGRYVRPGEKPMSLSRVVSYADLDLSRAQDMALLKDRVSLTARRICTELGEAQPNQNNLGRACQDNAVRDAMSRFEVASVDAYAAPASAVVADGPVAVVTNGPVPDTRENRAAYGGPQSRAGRMTPAVGN